MTSPFPAQPKERPDDLEAVLAVSPLLFDARGAARNPPANQTRVRVAAQAI